MFAKFLASKTSSPLIWSRINVSSTRPKYEISKTDAFNPIKLDVKDGKPRAYPFDSLVNYGCCPQTWEDPDVYYPDTTFRGT